MDHVDILYAVADQRRIQLVREADLARLAAAARAPLVPTAGRSLLSALLSRVASALVAFRLLRGQRSPIRA